MSSEGGIGFTVDGLASRLTVSERSLRFEVHPSGRPEGHQSGPPHREDQGTRKHEGDQRSDPAPGHVPLHEYKNDDNAGVEG